MSVDEHLEEPDLRKYAAIDMAALKDVRQTGAEFVRNIEALRHSTPGLAPGYLSEAESTALIVGVSNFLKNFRSHSQIVFHYNPYNIPPPLFFFFF